MPNFGPNYVIQQSPATGDEYGGRYATYSPLFAQPTSAETARWADISQKARMGYFPGISPWEIANITQSEIPVQLPNFGGMTNWFNPATGGFASSSIGPFTSSEVYMGPEIGWRTLDQLHKNPQLYTQFGEYGKAANRAAWGLPAYNSPTTTPATTTPQTAPVSVTPAINQNRYNTFVPERDYNPFPTYNSRRSFMR